MSEDTTHVRYLITVEGLELDVATQTCCISCLRQGVLLALIKLLFHPKVGLEDKVDVLFDSLELLQLLIVGDFTHIGGARGKGEEALGVGLAPYVLSVHVFFRQNLYYKLNFEILEF